MIKKLFLSLLTLALILMSFAPSIGQAKESTEGKKDYVPASQQEIQEAIDNTEVEIDIIDSEGKVEKDVLNDDGEVIGTLGIEEVDDNPVIGPQASTIPKGQNKKYKVYWYAATVNYHFYVTVNVSKSTGLGKIVSTSDEWYLVVPPGIVSSDKVTIPRKNETKSNPAEARYTLKMTAPVSTSLWIYGRVKDGKFKSGGN